MASATWPAPSWPGPGRRAPGRRHLAQIWHAAASGLLLVNDEFGKWVLTCAEKLSAPSATRTRDLLLRRQLLYPLSYRGQPITALPGQAA